MKYHKIPKVEKSVCTAEQMIAYNIAWRLFDTPTEKLWKNKEAYSRAAQSDFIHERVRYGMKLWKNAEPNSHYNEDAIFSALNAGLENYFNAQYKILTDYTDVGKMFPAHYLKEAEK